MSSGNDYWSGIFSRTAGQSLQDAERIYLLANGGVAGSNNDLWHQALRAASYTGSLNDMRKAWIDAGAAFTVPAHMFCGGDTTGDIAYRTQTIKPTNKLEIIARITPRLAAKGSAGVIAAVWDTAKLAYYHQLGASGTISILMSADGATAPYAFTSTSTWPYGNATEGWTRMHYDGATVDFFFSADGESWTAAGSTAHTVSMFQSTEELGVGGQFSPNQFNTSFDGKIHDVWLSDGEGTPFDTFEPDDQVGETSFGGWTLSGNSVEIIAD